MNFKKTILSAYITLLFSFSANAAIIDFIGVKANKENTNLIEQRYVSDNVENTSTRKEKMKDVFRKTNAKNVKFKKTSKGSFGLISGHYYNEIGETPYLIKEEIDEQAIENIWIPYSDQVERVLLSSEDWSPLPQTVDMGVLFEQTRSAMYEVTTIKRERLSGNLPNIVLRHIDTTITNEVIVERRFATGTKDINDPNNTAGFSIKSNGFTIECLGQPYGTIGIINGKRYKVTDNDNIHNDILNHNTLIYDDVCTSNVTDMTALFSNNQNWNLYVDISKFDTSNVTTMERTFEYSTFSDIDLSKWDVSKVVNMKGMFNNAHNFNGDISNWDTSSVLNMSEMFQSALLFNQPLNHFNTSNVTNMQAMFASTQSFNQPLNNWNTSKVTNMREMFSNTMSFNQDLSSWDFSSIYVDNNSASSGLDYMFTDARVYNHDISFWSVNNIPSKPEMFEHNSLIFKLPFHWADNPFFKYALNGVTVECDGEQPGQFGMFDGVKYLVVDNDLIKTEVEKETRGYELCTTPVTSIKGLFYNKNVDPTLYLYKWDTKNVNDMSLAFMGSLYFNEDLSLWNTSNVTNMSLMFAITYDFNNDLSLWDVSKVKDFSGMFMSAESFEGMIGNWDTSSAKSMVFMFSNAFNFNQEIRNWDVSNVELMIGMFEDAYDFDQPLGEWNTSNVRAMSGMFKNAYNFSGGFIYDWDVSKVKDFSHMFENAYNFTGNGIGQWNTSNAYTMESMFENAFDFNENLSSWNFNGINIENILNLSVDARKAIEEFTTNLGGSLSSLTDSNGNLIVSPHGYGNLNYMFFNAVTYNQDISNWNLDHIVNYPTLFSDGSQITGLPPHW